MLGATVASVAAVAVLAVALGALSSLATLPSAAGADSGPCDDPIELLVSASVLDQPADALRGDLIACVDVDHRGLTIHNSTPVVWVLSDPGVRGVVSQNDLGEAAGVSGLLSSYSSRIGSGLVLAPGASAAISAGPGRLAPRPDADATRLYLALSALVGAQDLVHSTEPPRAPRSVVRTAALTCALTLVRERGEATVLGPTTVAAAAADPVCADAWGDAQATALGDGWYLPALASALATSGRPQADEALARAAADWFRAADGFAWSGVDRPERLD